jgi:hypothetical protein
MNAIRHLTTLARLELRIREIILARGHGRDALRILPGELSAIFAELAPEPADLPPIPVDAARRWGVIDLTPPNHPAFAMRAFRWLPGSFTTPHDHPTVYPGLASPVTLIYVPGGELEEQIWLETPGRRAAPGARRSILRGQSVTSEASERPYIHRLINRGPAPATSIHVYAPAVWRERMRDWRYGRPTRGAGGQGPRASREAGSSDARGGFDDTLPATRRRLA